jgi:D-glycero-D-manno-heptose 1,7-bisphosphate phosphatase
MDAMRRHDRMVFLDRDGVINKQPPPGGWVLRWEEFEFADGALAALRRLHEHGFTVVVVTNQSCVGRGLIGLEAVHEINARMAEVVARSGGEIAGVYVCPHTDEDQCPCRKPRPGLLSQAARDLSLDPARAFLVGDSERDMQAGAAKGCTTILLAHAQPPAETSADHTVSSFGEAVELILGLVT